MRHLFWWQFPVLLFAAAVATAQVPTSSQSGPAPGNPAADGTRAAGPDQQVTVTAPRAEQPLPDLPPDEFTRCMGMMGYETIDYTQGVLCEAQLSREKHIVIKACIDKKGDTAPARVIQACTEALERNVYEGNARYFLFASRAAGYFAQGDKQRALDDYNEAVKLAPRNAYLYYNRGVFYAAQSENAAAMRDFDSAIGINSQLVPALRQRARIYLADGKFSDAREDYSKAIGAQPKTAALWSERGYAAVRHTRVRSRTRPKRSGSIRNWRAPTSCGPPPRPPGDSATRTT